MSSPSGRSDDFLPAIIDGLKFLVHGLLEVSYDVLILVHAPMNMVRA